MASSSVARQHLWNRYSIGLKESFCSSDQERTDVSGNARSPPIDGSNEASDTGVERQRDNQDGDEAGRPVQLDGREAKGDYSDPCMFSKMLHSGLYLIKAG